MDLIRKFLRLLQTYTVRAKYNFGKSKYVTCYWSSAASKGNASVLFLIPMFA